VNAQSDAFLNPVCAAAAAAAQVVGLPMVGRDLFERVVNHAMSAEEAVDRATNTAHLKADKPRRPTRCANPSCSRRPHACVCGAH
jgi:hypothetical protein